MDNKTKRDRELNQPAVKMEDKADQERIHRIDEGCYQDEIRQREEWVMRMSEGGASHNTALDEYEVFTPSHSLSQFAGSEPDTL